VRRAELEVIADLHAGMSVEFGAPEVEVIGRIIDGRYTARLVIR